MTRPQVVAIANYKGGSSKTTTAVHLAHALHRLGHRTVLVDADPQQSTTSWARAAGDPFALPVAALVSRELDRSLWRSIDPGAFDAAVIDCPPQEEAESIAIGAARAATTIVVPLAPTMAELDRVTATLSTLRRLELHDRAHVLLTRTVANAASTELIREHLVGQGWSVIPGSIPRRERYAQAWGAPIASRDVPHALVAEHLAATWAAVAA